MFFDAKRNNLITTAAAANYDDNRSRYNIGLLSYNDFCCSLTLLTDHDLMFLMSYIINAGTAITIRLPRHYQELHIVS